jgi:hypothetical protein
MGPLITGSKDHMIAMLIKTFATIRDLRLPYDSMWFRKLNFSALVVETAKHIAQLPSDCQKELLALEKNVLANRTNTAPEFYKYCSHMYQATHGRAARVVRGEFLKSTV